MRNLESIVNTQQADSQWERFELGKEHHTVISTEMGKLKVENRHADIPQFSHRALNHWRKLASSAQSLKNSAIFLILAVFCIDLTS